MLATLVRVVMNTATRTDGDAVVHTLEREQLVRAPLDEVFAFFARARNLESITPPWLGFTVLSPEPVELSVGSRIAYRLRLHGVPVRWITRIDRWEPARSFVDRQLRGPYRLWVHRHEFSARDGSTVVRDRVRYALPLGPLGTFAHAAFVRRDLDRIFDYRRDAVRRRLG
jgi:ligand-binding SRPBCC domain-containing protein